MSDYIKGVIDDVKISAIDEDNRTATFVAATENPLRTMFGLRFMKIAGLDLKRFKKNPVILDSHDSFTIRSVVGRGASMKKAGKEFILDIIFAATERAEEAWQLVLGGFINAVSVGFHVDRKTIVELAEGETFGKGENKITGPATIFRNWELHEVSLVPVPLDSDALRVAGMEDAPPWATKLMQSLEARAISALANNEAPETEDHEMGDKDKITEDAPVKGPETVETHAAASPALPAPTELELRTRDIRAIAPIGMEAMAGKCIVEGKSVEESRAVFLAELTKQSAYVGTSEPEVETPEPDNQETTKHVADVSDKDFLHALC